MVKLNGHILTKIGRAEGVLQGVLFHVTPSVSVGDEESNYLVASLGLETVLKTDQTFAVFLGDANGNVLQDWPCAYSAEEFVCGGIEQPVPWAMDLIAYL